MENFIFDAHQDVLWHEQNVKKNKQTGIKMLIKSPVKLVVASAFVDPDQLKKSKKKEVELVEEEIKKYLSLVEKNQKLTLIRNKGDIKKIISSDLTGMLIHIEGLDFINEDNVDILNKFYKMGLRSVGLVWGKRNNICSDIKSRGGLTKFGKEFIEKCNILGIIIDMSHANEKSFNDVLKTSKKPIMVSHGNCYSLCRRKRNIKDRQIKKISRADGVQGIFFSEGYVSRKKNISINDAVDHFTHAYFLAPDSVMIGSDFGGITAKLIDNLENINDLTTLLDKVEKRISKKAMQKIAYKNFLDFLEKSFMKSKNDFTLGILGGMGPMAGVEMQKRIIENTPARFDEDHIKMICFTNPKIKDRSKSIKEKRDFSEGIITSLKLMEKTGVDIGIISCNTAHADFEKISIASAIPLMNMIEETVSYIKCNFPNMTSVGVIATNGTIASKVYEKYLKKNDIIQIIPNKASQKNVMNVIHGIKAGNSGEVKVRIIKKVIGDLMKERAEIVILGCTELSTLGIKGRSVVDPIEIVSKKIIDNYHSV